MSEFATGTNFPKETGEATAHRAAGFGIHWTSSFKYIPNLLNSIGPVDLNRVHGVHGLCEEDAKDNRLSAIVCSV